MGKRFGCTYIVLFNDFFSPFTFQVSLLKMIIAMSGCPGKKDFIYSSGRG